MMADSSTSAGSSVHAILTYWKKFDLQNLQKELDETATDLANRQDDSDASRKKLVEQSKEFKKSAPEDVRKYATPLLKSFQGEIDNLSKRSKAAEAAFLDLYKKIIESPDPVQALEGAVQWQKRAQRVQDLEIENANFRDTLDQYNVEFAEIKNQEVTIRQLKEKVKNFEEHIEHEVQTKADEKEAALQRFFQDRERQLQEAGGILSMKLQEAERRAESLQSSLTAAQQELFALRARADDSRDARATEVEMVVADLERANQRAESAEREAQAVREELNELKSKGVAEGQKEEKETEEFKGQLTAMEIELTAKDRQIRQLLEEVKQVNLKLAEANVNFEEEKKGLRGELQEKTRTLESLEARLNSQADYEDLKKELKVMKSIEFGSGEEEGSSEGDGGKSLEVLLLEKNKSLQAEKTALNVARRELEGKCVDGGGGGGQIAGQVQHVLDAFECLVGAELVSAYAQSQIGNKMKRELRRAELESVIKKLGKSGTLPGGNCSSSSTGANLNSNLLAPAGNSKSSNLSLSSQKSLEEEEEEVKGIESKGFNGEMAADINTVIKKHGLFDFDQANREGMPRDLAELAVAEQLQEIIGASAAKIGDSPLNTVQIARHCRQLLAMYNLGQRLFAKTILNQSQGSLSELLSKPRPWHRLTEKGREAFRKIYAWVSDERAVVLLRTLSPRRIYNPSSYVYGGKEESSSGVHTSPGATGHSVSKCEKEQATNNRQENGKDPLPPRSTSSTFSAKEKSEEQMGNFSVLFTPISTSGFTTPSKQMSPTSVLVTQAEDGKAASGCMGDSQNSSNRVTVNNRWRHDDIPKEMIVEIYNRELNKLKEQEHTLCQELRGRSAQRSGGKPQREPPKNQSSPNLKNTTTTTAATPCEESVNSPNTTSLQYSSSCSQNLGGSAGGSSGSGTKFLKAVLPAITQEQFEKYSNIATEELVKTVKDFLTQQSISQRLFGENILGLSQGSVSDLLARPKPWHMLTQKGREPFIRMKVFLADPEAIEALKSKKACSSPVPGTTGNSNYGNGMKQPSYTSSWTYSSNAPNCSMVSKIISQACSTNSSSVEEEKLSNHSRSSSVSGNMVADSPRIGELDTEAIVEQVKEILHGNGIGQKLFGEAVLGVSQGTVSELLSKPKLWPLLSLRGREPYIRMHWWLQDPLRVQKLQDYCMGQSSSSALSLSKGISMSGMKRPYDVMNDEWNSTGGLSSMGLGNFSKNSTIFGPPAYKKPRSLISEQQKEALRFAFEHEPYPSSKTVEFLSDELQLSVRTVVNWFHNHRMRIKLQSPTSVLSGGPLDFFHAEGELSDQQVVSSSDTRPGGVMASSMLDGERCQGMPGVGGVSSTASWRKNLQDLISLLSTGEENLDSEVTGFRGGSGGGAGGVIVKEEPPTSPEVQNVSTEMSLAESRKSLLEKLEQNVNQSDLDWNAGLREEALSKLAQHVNRKENGTHWEF